MALSIANLPWGDRRQGMFIDTMVKSASVLERFKLVDGVKSKVNVPIFDASLTFGTDLCAFDPQSSASISEKEMSVETYKWAFLNCKNALETSYRSVLLKKGQHNEETMDAEFKDWVFTHFAKLSAVKALELAATQIEGELALDSDVIKPAAHGLVVSPSNILGLLETAYTAMSADMLSAVYGDADRAFKPAIFLSTAAVQAYQIAIAGLHTTTPQGLVDGAIPAYYGMEIVHFPSLGANNILVAAPENLVMLTDDYNDVRAIDMKWEAELSSDKIWGQFKLGFSYLNGAEIVYYAA